MTLIGLLGLAIVVFASTNIDDIFVLLGFMSDRRIRTRNIVIGQYLGIGVLVAVSLVASLISVFLSPAYVGLLGTLPILIGAKKLLDLRGATEVETAPDASHGGALGQIGSVAAVTIANGGDNIGVYTPLFATQSALGILITAIVFVAMTALWIASALRLVGHPSLGLPIRRYGHIAVPILLVELGIRILYNAGSLTLLGFPLS
jgi:cadmium resistance protein CadD (predicted permease)